MTAITRQDPANERPAMNTTTTTPDTCSGRSGAYDLPIEVLNGKPFCEECADEM